ncbi:MAG: hypothetical protein J6Q57_06190, partial [Paraprevotella sp.]|nr:hypothetical protein [Paraprevotella sp.]
MIVETRLSICGKVVLVSTNPQGVTGLDSVIRCEIVHIVKTFQTDTFGYDYAPELTKENTAQEAVDAINAAGGLAILAHPAWSLNTHDM